MPYGLPPSSHMRTLGNLHSYADLAAMTAADRNILRLASFCEIAREAQRTPVFLDAHFMFEDGEQADFSSLAEATRHVIVVRCAPEIIQARAVADEHADHPGRTLVRNGDLEFVRRYQDADTTAARQFADSICGTYGRTVGFYLLDNSADECSLRRQAETLIPHLYQGLEGGRGSHRDGIIGLPRIEW